LDLTVRGELRAASPPARRWRGRLQEVPELGRPSGTAEKAEVYFEPAPETHARLGENAAKAQAGLAELKARRRGGSLLDAEAVEREWSDVLGTVRAGMLAVPSRAGPIDAEVSAVLSEIGNVA
jgi:phage terminase Nu1 subunit (DNA packaging protein)